MGLQVPRGWSNFHHNDGVHVCLGRGLPRVQTARDAEPDQKVNFALLPTRTGWREADQ